MQRTHQTQSEGQYKVGDVSRSCHPGTDSLTGIFAAANSGRYLSGSGESRSSAVVTPRHLSRQRKKRTSVLGRSMHCKKTKTASVLLPAVVRWARPTSYFRAHLCPPPFSSLHPSTPVSTPPESGCSHKSLLLDVSRT